MQHDDTYRWAGGLTVLVAALAALGLAVWGLHLLVG